MDDEAAPTDASEEDVTTTGTTAEIPTAADVETAPPIPSGNALVPEIAREEVVPGESGATVPEHSASVENGAASVTTPPTQDVPLSPSTIPAPLSPPTPAGPHFGHYSVKEAQEMSNRRRADVFRHKEEKILAHIRAHGSITKDQAARLFFVSGNSAYLYLKRMVNEGVLVTSGRGRATTYVIR